jgi:hypothetical protein
MMIYRMLRSNRIRTLLLLATFVFLFAAPASADDWRVGNIVGLCKGTRIRKGPGYNYAAHTTVPENDWAVKIIDGPRYANGEEWWDTSHKAAGDSSGSTGWVSKRQATACKAAPPTTARPPPTVCACTPPSCRSDQVSLTDVSQRRRDLYRRVGVHISQGIVNGEEFAYNSLQ